MASKSKALAPAQAQSTAVAEWNQEQLRVLRDAIAPDLNPTELQLFGIAAARSGLDPFAKQIYAIKRQGKVKFQTSIDGYRSIAARTGEYDGQDEPTFDEPCPCGQEPKGHPKSATKRVYRKGMGRGVAATAFWHEYKPAPGNSGDGDIMWRKMPHVMLAKVAEALALRQAFPYVMTDIYTAEEMEQADDPAPRQITGTVARTDHVHAAGEPPPDTAEAEVSGSAEAQESGARVAAATPDSDAYFEGAVIVPLPEVREVKRPDWYKDLPPEQKMAKAELKFQVGRAKHTAIVLGEYAYAVFDAKLAEGDTVRVAGVRVEVQWQKDMPTKKEIRFVTAVDVLRDGDWQNIVPGTSRPTLPLEEPPEKVVTEQKAVVVERESNTGERKFEVVGVEPPVVEGDFTELVEQAFGKGTVKTLEDYLALPAATGEGDIDKRLVFLQAEPRKTTNGTEYHDVRLTDGAKVYRGVMDKAEGDAQLLEDGALRYGLGEEVRIVGVWQGTFILLTAVTA